MQKCLFSCMLNSDGLVRAALSPFAANHCGSCLPFLQGLGAVEGEILGFCSIILCFRLRFPGTVKLCNALGIVLLCIRQLLAQSRRKHISRTKRCSFRRWGRDVWSCFFKEMCVEEGRYKDFLYVYCSFPAGLFPSSFLGLPFRAQWTCQAQATLTVSEGRGQFFQYSRDHCQLMEGLQLLLENHILSFCPGHVAQ